LQNVRNALAHANGRVVEQHPDRRKELEALAASGKMIKIVDGHVVVQEASFLHHRKPRRLWEVNSLTSWPSRIRPFKERALNADWRRIAPSIGGNETS